MLQLFVHEGELIIEGCVRNTYFGMFDGHKEEDDRYFSFGDAEGRCTSGGRSTIWEYKLFACDIPGCEEYT